MILFFLLYCIFFIEVVAQDYLNKNVNLYIKRLETVGFAVRMNLLNKTSERRFMKIVPISKEEHLKWSYKGLHHYLHTQKDSIVPVVMAEIGRLVTTNPIVFIGDKDNMGLYSLQSVFPETNLMIDSQGLWVSDYIPARYRSLPFVLASEQSDKETKDKVLCYVEDVQCVAKKFDKDSTKIFDKKGQLSENMQKVFEFLQSIEQNHVLTKKAVDSIQKAGLLQDWTLSIKLVDGEKNVTNTRMVFSQLTRTLRSR